MFIAVIMGLAVGSFLNVLIWRLNDDKVPKFWQGRSICPMCRHELSWKDNIPLLSFLFLKGRCRYCWGKISWQYPVVELVTAGTFVGIGELGNWGIGGIWLSGLAAVFIVIFFSDLIYGLIPDEAVAAGIGLSFLSYLGHLSDLGVATATGIISSLAFFLVVVATRFRGMGLGDVKLAFLMGLLLGWPKTLVAFWSAFVLGGMVAVFLLLLKRTKLSATIALGPFLVIGTIISALWSKQILHLVLP